MDTEEPPQWQQQQQMHQVTALEQRPPNWPPIEDILNPIKKVMAQHAVPTSKETASPLKFTDVMGSDQSKWWRLYIDPKDWAEASKLQDPGTYYDRDRSNGYKASMLKAYQNHLVVNDIVEAFEDRTVERATTFYVQLWHELTANVVPEPNHSFVYRGKDEHNVPTDDSKPVYFPSYPEMAEDLTENVYRKPDRVERTYKVPPKKSYIEIYGPCVLHAVAQGQIVDTAIAEVIEEYMTVSGFLETAESRLLQIASFIRTLHLLHPFTDGNGRAHIFTILPALLLRHGFGLPLDYETHNLHPWTLYVLFNGSFTLEQIAAFLWAAQDFGEVEEDESLL